MRVRESKKYRHVERKRYGRKVEGQRKGEMLMQKGVLKVTN